MTEQTGRTAAVASMGGRSATRKPARWAFTGLLVLALLVYPQVAGRFYISLGTEALYLALFAMSFNLMFGYMGMLSFGHAAYFGLGAYAMALLLRRTDLPFAAAATLAPLIAATFALAVGYFSLRLRHPTYFAMLTLAFGQILYTVAFQWYSFTGGDNGLVGIPRPDVIFDSVALYYFTLGVALAALAVLWLLIVSPYGLMLRAIRDNKVRAEAVGIPVWRMQLLTFVIAGFFAGIAGMLTAVFQSAVFPDYLFWTRSGEVIIVSLLGGTGYFLGPAFGAAVYLGLNKWVTGFTEYWSFTIGVILLVIVLVARGGLIGLAYTTSAWVRGRLERVLRR